MQKKLIDAVREFLQSAQGKEIDLAHMRRELKIDKDTPAWDGLRTVMFRLIDEKLVRSSGRKDGIYKVIKQVKPVYVFDSSRERRPPSDISFPLAFDTFMEMDFRENIVIREGDLILITGVSNYGKTTLAMNFCGANIDKNPVLLGNEYTTPDNEPTPRFLNRLDSMDWVEWVNGTGQDKFTLLPVSDDYAEHVVKDRINIIDWINMETGEHYMIGTVLNGIKRQVGKGVAIAVIQKAEGTELGRGGQFTKDFTDCELQLDKYGPAETLLTIGKVKESTKPVTGLRYAFTISKGVRIMNFRQVKKCPHCNGYGKRGAVECMECQGRKYVDA